MIEALSPDHFAPTGYQAAIDAKLRSIGSTRDAVEFGYDAPAGIHDRNEVMGPKTELRVPVPSAQPDGGGLNLAKGVERHDAEQGFGLP